MYISFFFKNLSEFSVHNNKTDLHDRTEILLKVTLNTIKSKSSFIKLSKKISALGSIGGGSAVLVKSFVFLF
jgi:hypothetical protein